MTQDESELLDEFAKYALQGILAAGGIRGHIDGDGDTRSNALWAYDYAEAMMAERKKH